MASKDKDYFTFTAQGHPNIQATHSSTFEITMEAHLSPKGDCIIGVNGSHGAQQLNAHLGDILRCPDSLILTQLKVGTLTEEIQGFGSPDLTLKSPTSLVWRTSNFVDDRTIAIHCNKAAKDLNRKLIALLQNPETTLHVALLVSPGVRSKSKTT